MTQRLRLDQCLLGQARGQGARVIEAVNARRIHEEDDAIRVEDSTGKHYRSRLVIGADGANSIVARNVQLYDGIQREIALESEIALPREAMHRWDNAIEIDLF